MIVEPERLQCGSWGYQEGDISASYSADIYAEKKQLRRPFNHAHTPHVAMSVCSSGFAGLEAKAYPLVHLSYSNQILEDYRNSSLKDGYTGKPIRRFGNDCVFGLPVIFRQRVLRIDEVIDLCRRMYAYGGLFAAQAESYDDLISGWYQKHPELREAFVAELESDLPQSQAAMREFIQIKPVLEVEQLSLL